jgi:hypothetical protein
MSPRKATAGKRKRPPNNRHVHNLARVLSYLHQARLSKSFLALKRIQPRQINSEGFNQLELVWLKRVNLAFGDILEAGNVRWFKAWGERL